MAEFYLGLAVVFLATSSLLLRSALRHGDEFRLLKRVNFLVAVPAGGLAIFGQYPSTPTSLDLVAIATTMLIVSATLTAAAYYIEQRAPSEQKRP